VRIGKLFHLTMLVDSFDGPELFFNSLFSPMCTIRGYSSFWHRDAAIYVIAETAIEPMHVLPPREGEEATSWFRFMDRFGPRVHNLAFYVDDTDALTARLEAAGVRTTTAGTGSTVFAHPKDTPGMLEFSATTGRHLVADPRFSPSWDSFRREYWPNHPLGLERLSHVTILVHDADAATAFYRDVLDGVVLPETSATLEGTTARYVLVGEDTVVELAQPTDPSSALARELQHVGQGAVTATFKVRDAAAAEEFLRMFGAPVATVTSDAVLLDRSKTWGLELRFTSTALAGDPRT